MSAGEIRALARAAGIAPGVSVIDLCCGVAGPGRLITRELGCDYLGVDLSSSAIRIARERAGDLPCRFEVARIPPLPHGPFDVVLLLETMLAFPDKATLLRAISSELCAGGRFAFTMEEGSPLTDAERATMPDADTVWLTPLPEMLGCLERTGLVVRWQDDWSRSHRAQADSLIGAFAADAAQIAAQIGRPALDELLAAHRLWSEWLREGRVRKLAFVAEKTGAPRERLAACREARADEQDVVVGVCSRHNLRRRRAERGGSVDLLTPGVLAGGPIGPGPEAVRGAGGPAVDVAAEDDCASSRATRKERSELGALRSVGADLVDFGRRQVRGAHVDAHSRADAQPDAPLGAGLRLERPALGAPDGCLRQHRVPEEPAPARADARERPAVVDHPREAPVITRPPRDQCDVRSAGLAQGDRVGMRLTDPGHRVLESRRIIDLPIAAADT